MWQKYNTQSVTIFFFKWDNEKVQNVTKLEMWQYSKTQNVKKKLKSKFYKSQKLNIWENWMTLKMGQNSK